MSIAANEIRQFWMPGLNEVVGKQKSGLVKWLSLGECYYVSSPLSQNQFSLDLSGRGFSNKMLLAFAYDCNRMASAAFETMWSIEKSTKLPNSTAWLLIKLYYSAFYSGHAIMRMLGISCSQIDKNAAGKILEIAKLFSKDNGLSISSSYYSCVYSKSQQELYFDNIKAKGGVHERFWNVFYERIKELGESILARPTIISQSQDVFKKLDELCQILSYGGCNGGSWLSAIRNRINYRHELNAWFPYDKGKQNFEDMYSKCSQWLTDPMDINLIIVPGNVINLFVSACSFIVSLCRVLVKDMSMRCSKGKSYLSNGSLKLLNQYA